jgi:hypothetical protein
VLRKEPRRICLVVKGEKKRSTGLIHEAPVGVK